MSDVAYEVKDDVDSPYPAPLEPPAKSKSTSAVDDAVVPTLAPPLDLSSPSGDTAATSPAAAPEHPAPTATEDETHGSPDASASANTPSDPSEDALSATEWEQVEKPSASTSASPSKDSAGGDGAGTCTGKEGPGSKLGGLKSPGNRFGGIMRRDSSKSSGKQDGRGSVEASPAGDKGEVNKEKEKDGGIGKKVDGVRKVLKSGMFGSELRCS